MRKWVLPQTLPPTKCFPAFLSLGLGLLVCFCRELRDTPTHNAAEEGQAGGGLGLH